MGHDAVSAGKQAVQAAPQKESSPLLAWLISHFAKPKPASFQFQPQSALSQIKSLSVFKREKCIRGQVRLPPLRQRLQTRQFPYDNNIGQVKSHSSKNDNNGSNKSIANVCYSGRYVHFQKEGKSRSLEMVLTGSFFPYYVSF